MATRIAVDEDPFRNGSAPLENRATSAAATRTGVVLAAPLSFAQERLWFLHQLEPEVPAYNVPIALHLHGDIDLELLERAVNEIIRRHAVLRTTFGLVDDAPQQFVAPSLHLRCELRDIQQVPEAERAAVAGRLASIEAATPFDLVRGPLLRVLLLRLAPHEHVLVITMHHIVSEGGWSMNVFLGELGSLYTALSRGEECSLPPLPLQYHEYAARQRLELDDDRMAHDLAYWTEQLRAAPAALELPTDRPRAGARHSLGARAELKLSSRLSREIRTLSRAERATVTMTLLAGWTALLARYTAQEDLTIGVPVAGRNRIETEPLIGLFLNTLVLRVDASGDPSFRDLLARVRSVTLAAYDHQVLPFERLVQELRPERVGTRMPLVQSIFAPQPSMDSALSIPGITVSRRDLGTGAAITDTMLFAWDEPDGIRIVLEYASELFDAERMRLMLEHYRILLAGAVESPALPLSTLPLLTEMERYLLLAEWSRGERVASDGRCVHELVAAMARRDPGATALVVGDESITYGELDERAELLADRLRAMGVGANVIVGIATERSVEMMTGLLAILKAGGAYLPLDPMYPAERLAMMISDSGTRLLLTQRNVASRIPDFPGTIVDLDEDWRHSARGVAAGLRADVAASDLAYVIYTSGSTGRPKGVQITHGALANLISAAQNLLEPGREDVLLGVTTLSFDIAGLEIWLPLVTGARVVLASRETAADGERLATLLRESGATIMQATPATWQLLLASGWRDGARLKVLCGGEPLTWKMATHLLTAGCRVWNMYGPTETTIWSTAYALEARRAGPCDEADIVPIGRPLANTELYVLGRHGELLPPGVPGELYIGGAGVARGYHEREELTRERFVPHPFAPEPAVRLYRTGDRVRWRADGILEFIGRIDHQIKLRGYRIEPGEIEATLREHPAVRDVVVALRDDAESQKMLVAYVVKREGSELARSELLEFARQRLPSYMIPSAVVELERFPLTPAGKVDRRALPNATRSDVGASEMYLAPRDEVEARLVALWERTLGVEPIGVRDNFFHLGGHSLLVARLFSEIEVMFGERLPLAALFAAPTIEELAIMLQANAKTRGWTSLVTLREGGARPPLFLVHGVGGNVVGYGNLLRHLAPDQPCYAFQAKGLDGREAPATTVEEMAASYNAELRAFRPRGPYALGGLSFGGTVAYEMARQLEAEGQRVALVALFDSCPTHAQWTLERSRVRTLVKQKLGVLAYHVRAMRTRSPGEILRYLRALGLRQVGKVRSALWRLRRRTIPNGNAGALSLEAVLRNVEESCLMAFRSYRPQPYRGRVTLFQAAIRGGDDEQLAAAWEHLALGGVEVVDVPGSHVTMLTSAHAEPLAERLGVCLAQAFATPRNDDVSERPKVTLPRSSGSG